MIVGVWIPQAETLLFVRAADITTDTIFISIILSICYFGFWWGNYEELEEHKYSSAAELYHTCLFYPFCFTSWLALDHKALVLMQHFGDELPNATIVMYLHMCIKVCLIFAIQSSNYSYIASLFESITCVLVK